MQFLLHYSYLGKKVISRVIGSLQALVNEYHATCELMLLGQGGMCQSAALSATFYISGIFARKGYSIKKSFTLCPLFFIFHQMIALK